MAQKNKKKKQQIRGMPKTSIQSRMPSKTAKGQAGKKAVVAKPKKKGLIASLKARRSKRASENKWVLGEKLTKAGRKRATARKGSKRLKKAGVTVSAKTAAASGKVRRGAVGATVTKVLKQPRVLELLVKQHVETKKVVLFLGMVAVTVVELLNQPRNKKLFVKQRCSPAVQKTHEVIPN